VVAVWLFVVLRWRELEARGDMASTSPSVKLSWGSPDLGGAVVMIPLSSH
jgi:hypothetical protein